MNTDAMSRKLHNTISAVMVSGAVLVLGLTAANPSNVPDRSGTSHAQAIAAAIPTLAPVHVLGNAAEASRVDFESQAFATPPGVAKARHRKSGNSSRIRQSMAVPYFSFVSRG
ncbi:hypothetical protein ACFQZQ_02005 [Lysobacter koreensis]|uniref:Serine protease n=1 Tax=Lysobacter koreensis TaxID=266122 RepID=A0ABW2YKT4_9GAMM